MKDGPQNHSYSGNHGGKPGQWVCRERIGQTFRTTAQVNLAARQLYPWENESFSVCMEGPRVDFRTGASPYSYGVDQVGLYDVTFNLTPNYRVPTPPDSDGMSYTAFTYKDGKFILNVSDRWATEYAGEQVAIKVELIKDGFLFFNSSKGEKTFTLNVAGNYELAFAESDLTKNKDFVDDSGDLKGAKKFFVKWGFRRIGRISTQDYIGKGDTSKIPQ
ncbi:MAG: hypothetical protein A2016_11605 [Elusimicrobia bacterium GWF2_62_30]|nr:MAG: hypothetical protein A2016_11605 [Elusimicrobia bacterium GWF2_62_30]